MFTVSTPCFLSFWDFRTSFFIEEAWFWGVRVGFGGREGALASALIYIQGRRFCSQLCLILNCLSFP